MSDTTVHASEGQHWYTRAGQPMYKVPARDGSMRPTTLRDARKLDLVPSVTTIIRCAAAPGLETWKQQQVLLSALTLGRQALEPEDDWVARVFRDSQEQGRAAAERGTEIHAAIERFYADHDAPYQRGTVEAAVYDAIDVRWGDKEWAAEIAFAHPSGFGGKVDLVAAELWTMSTEPHGIILDLKTKDSVDDSTKGYEEHLMQLAAYRVGLGREQAVCANLFVSRQEPWTVRIHEWTDEDMQRGWAMFRSLLAFYVARTGYDASWEPTMAVAS